MIGFIYAISAGKDRVKIGWSADPRSRFVKIQSDNAEECFLLGVKSASRQDEARLLASLERHRLRGEWFRRGSQEIEELISSMNPVGAPAKYVGFPSGHALRDFRRSVRMTLADLAAKVGVVPSHLSQIERGDRGPSLDLASKLSRLTGIPLDHFVRESAQ